MPRRAALRLVQLAVAGAVVTTVAGIGVTSASAVDEGCSHVSVTKGSAASTRVAISRLTACLQRLEKASDTAGRAAQRADERYLRAEAASRSAGRERDRAKSGADAAAARAGRSRARAGAVGMQLARAGGTGEGGSLLLDDRGATETLYSLSRLTQLTEESHQLAERAAQDSAAARSLRAQAIVKSQGLRRWSADAQAAFVSAKHESEAVAALVTSQRSRIHSLQAQLAALTPPPSTASQASSAAVDLPADASAAARAVAFARAQIGDPYVFAAAGPGSWDCSGLTMGAYASVGISIGIHSATAQYDLERSLGRLVPYADRRPGDLIFYTDGGGDMYHTAIYSGNGMMVEAPYEGVDVREVPVRTDQLVGEVARPSA